MKFPKELESRTDTPKFREVAFYPKEDNIFMPNEIFDDFQCALANKSSHVAFAYSYYYFVTYLYRYTKHFYIKDFRQGDIKEFLGYSPRNQVVDYIIKKNGVLDDICYTETTTDIPCKWELRNDGVHFTMSGYWLAQNFDDLTVFNRKNRTIKFPLRGFYRNYLEEGGTELNGTFYNVENTHNIHPYVFIKAMENKEIGTKGFYLYGFLKSQSDRFNAPYVRSFEKLQQDSKMSAGTLSKYLVNLDRYGYIQVDKNDFVIGLPQDKRRANTYTVNSLDRIMDEPREIRKRYVYYYEPEAVEEHVKA